MLSRPGGQGAGWAGADRLRNRSRFGRAADDPASVSLAGMVFSGGYRPRDRELDAIRASGLFAYLVEEETLRVASDVHDLLVKPHPADSAKIDEIRRLVAEHFDVEALLERLRRAADGGAVSERWVRAGWERISRGVASLGSAIRGPDRR